jgi:DNA polymerase III delta prime subunit
MDFSSLWCEKYRPKNIEDLCISDEIHDLLESFKQKKDIPHLLFVGTPGIGKSSLSKIIVNDILGCDYLYINASDENGIDTIRHKIVGFSQTKSMDGGLKVVILDESDSFSVDASRCLRNILEEYAHNTRFILTANYKHRIIDAIQSRCQTVNLEHNINDVAKHCAKILAKEKIKIPKEQIDLFQTLIRNNFPDFRKILNELQKYSISGTLNIRDTSLPDEFVDELFDKIKNNDDLDFREYVIKNENVFQADYHNLLKTLLNLIYTKNIDSFKKKEAIMTIGHHMDRHSFVMDVEINSFVCMVTLSKIFHA